MNPPPASSVINQLWDNEVWEEHDSNEGDSSHPIAEPSRHAPLNGGQIVSLEGCKKPTAMQLQAGWIREVASRSRASSNQVAPKPPPASLTARVHKRDYAFYCTTQSMVPGTLSISDSVITFEPDRRGVAVRRCGLGEFQVVIPISEVSETAAVILPRTRAIERLFDLPSNHTGDAPSWATAGGSSPTSSASLPSSSHQMLPNEPALGLLQILLRPQALRGKRTRTSTMPGSIKSPSLVAAERQSPSDARRYSPAATNSLDPTPTNRELYSNLLQLTDEIKCADPDSSNKMNDNSTSHRRRSSAARLCEMAAIVGESTRQIKSMEYTATADKIASKQVEPVPTSTAADDLLLHSESRPPSHKPPKSRARSFVMFRLSSPEVVKEATRILLDLIDRSTTVGYCASDPDGHGTAFVPHLSNTALDTLMRLCIDDKAEEDPMPSQTHSEHQKHSQPSHAVAIERLHSAPTKLLDAHLQLSSGWLFRPSPPKFEMPPGANPLLGEHMSIQLSTVLPPTVALRPWQLLFDTSLHGISLLSFYARSQGHAPAFVLVRDDHNWLFGGYSPEGFRESRHYYGTGETFVFTYENVGDESTPANNKDIQIKSYGWSGRNNHFLYSDSCRIFFGGGGQYAFALDHDLLHGICGACPTFNNPVLASSEDFAIQRIQVWGFENL